MQRPMPEAHQCGLAVLGPFLINVVSSEIVSVAGVGVIHERMMGGNHEPAARPQHAVELAQGRPPVLQVVQHQRGQDDVEAARREAQRLSQVSLVQGHVGSEPLAGYREHAATLVQAGHDGPTADQLGDMRARSAARVHDAQSGHVPGQG